MNIYFGRWQRPKRAGLFNLGINVELTSYFYIARKSSRIASVIGGQIILTIPKPHMFRNAGNH